MGFYKVFVTEFFMDLIADLVDEARKSGFGVYDGKLGFPDGKDRETFYFGDESYTIVTGGRVAPSRKSIAYKTENWGVISLYGGMTLEQGIRQIEKQVGRFVRGKVLHPLGGLDMTIKEMGRRTMGRKDDVRERRKNFRSDDVGENFDGDD